MLTRRQLLAGVPAAAMAGALGRTALATPARMSPAEAHRKAVNGEILLLDIRSPGEWKRTGVGASARPVSMHEPGFMQKVEELTGGDKSRPVALICASGGRSSAMQERLGEAGYSNVVNVAEGMVGGRNGPGWFKAGLPVKPYEK